MNGKNKIFFLFMHQFHKKLKIFYFWLLFPIWFFRCSQLLFLFFDLCFSKVKHKSFFIVQKNQKKRKKNKLIFLQKKKRLLLNLPFVEIGSQGKIYEKWVFILSFSKKKKEILFWMHKKKLRINYKNFKYLKKSIFEK